MGTGHTPIGPGGCYHPKTAGEGVTLLSMKVPKLRIRIGREGGLFILPAAGAAVFLAIAGWWWLAAPAGALAVLFALFFRDPEREVPSLPGVIVAPADGKVVQG